MEQQALLESIRREAEELAREMPFSEYLERARAEPRLDRRAHHLVFDMIRESQDGDEYALFRDELFGAQEVIDQVVDYFRAAARGEEVRRRILLLVGPPGSGKSTLVNALKRGLEDYTRRSPGEVYAIKGCPVHEDPLHLLPAHRRPELPGLGVEGDLCPYCRWLVRELYRGDVARVPVQRVVFSATDGVGIGTFVATDPRSEDLSRLVGRVDLSALLGPSRPAAQRAFRLDGELNAANRGLADLIEVLKMDERFLTVLLTVSQEQVIKLSGPGTMYVDEVLVAHSNLAEYEALVADPRAAALQDRLVVVRVPYLLSVGNEVRIYRKLLGNDGRLSPLALPAAATLAVLTRLRPPQLHGWTLARKLRLYDRRYLPEAQEGDLEVLRQAAPEEGWFGVSPRYVVTQLSQVLARGEGCLGGLQALRVLWEGLRQRAGFREEERETWSELFAVAREEYDEMARKAVRRALVPGYGTSAQALVDEAVRDLASWSQETPEPELAALPRLERALDIPQYRRASFRQRLLAAAREDEVPVDFREAADRVLLPSWEQAARRLSWAEGQEEIRRRLVEEHDFAEACAEELVAQAVALTERRPRRAGPLRWLTG